MKKENSNWKNPIPRTGAKHWLMLSALVLFSFCLNAQNGTWYFGTNGGMSFTNTGTVPLAGSVMTQSEGCASIVDANNNIVMYTNGISIWNGVHVNQGYTLSGAASTTQSAVIVPIPQLDCRAYYIFTVAAAETNYGNLINRRGLRVSLANVTGVAPNCTVTIVSANLDVNLMAAAFPNDLVAEKLCAVSDGSGGYWVTAHGVGLYQSYSGGTFNTPINTGGEANFYSVHVTAANNTIANLAASLLVNTFGAGQHRSTVIGGGVYSGQGQMKYNTFGTQIGCAMTGTREVQLYDVNPATGVISNQILLPTAFTIAGDDLTYGFEFSANGNFAYVSTTFGSNNGVFQLDISSGNAATISASKTQVGFGPGSFGYYYGALQIGPDDQIYVALPTQTSLDVISTPNQLACNYFTNAAAIAGTCNLGLPSVLRNSPCEGNEYQDCVCDARTELWEMSSLDENGIINIGFFLNSGTVAKKIKITLVNYNQLTSPGCELCNPTVVNSYGTITNNPIIGGTPSVLTAATNPGGAAFSRELIWFFATPQVVSQPVNLSFQFPPVNGALGCTNGVEFCLKIEYWDEDCHVCENAIYIVIGGDGHGKIKSPSVDETGSTGAIESKSNEPSADKMHVYPNPAANSITIEIPSITEGTNVKIFDSFGKLVIEQMVTGPTNVINTESLTPGLYSVRYMNGKDQYVSTLMISK